MKIHTSAFDEGGTIPARHSEDGEDLSPELRWDAVPDGTRELALIMDDPDAPRAEPWVHWLLYGLPADCRELPEGITRDLEPSSLKGVRQGKNSWDENNIGYRGPAPPKGHGTHHYHFRLYALDAPLELAPGADRSDLTQAMAGHVLAEAEVIGTYER